VLAELHVAKELGLTLGQLRREMTMEEVWLWVTYFNLQVQEQEKAQRKAMRKR
jgi:hypothetical protein